MANNLHRQRGKEQRVTHGVMKVVFLLAFLLITSASAYALRLYFVARDSIGQTFTGKSANAVANFSDQRPISILLLGVDTGAEGRIDKGNSDTMIVATINPKTKKTLLVSIPRDTAAQLIGTRQFNMQKVNAAYNVGSSTMAKNTISKLLNIPINYYVTVNMGGMEQIVNAVGGIDVDVPFSFTSHYTGGQHFTKGPMHLNGNMALAYARMRHEDVQKGDYGRQERQQQVIKAVLSKAISMNGITHFTALLKSVSGNLSTDLSFDDMVGIFSHYRGAAKTVSTDTLHGQNALVQTPEYSFPLAYQVAGTSELQRVSDKTRESLGLSKEALVNAETQQNAKNPNFKFNATDNQNYTIFNLP